MSTCDVCMRDDHDGLTCADCIDTDFFRDLGEKKAIEAVVDYLRHTAVGYAIMRSIKANGARDALYAVAEKLEKDYRAALGSRLAEQRSGGTDG